MRIARRRPEPCIAGRGLVPRRFATKSRRAREDRARGRCVDAPVLPRNGCRRLDHRHGIRAPARQLGDAFLEMADYLAKLSVRAPRVVRRSRAGRVVLEDLGDVTLELAVASRPRSAWLPLYEQAIDVVRRIQDGARAAPAPDIKDSRACKNEKAKAGLQGPGRTSKDTGASRSAPPDRSALDAALGELARAAAERPFSHRDFHARNIIVRDDYDRARRLAETPGRAYDLASLLHDSSLDEPARETFSSRGRSARRDALARGSRDVEPQIAQGSPGPSATRFVPRQTPVCRRGSRPSTSLVNFLRDRRWSDLHACQTVCILTYSSVNTETTTVNGGQ
ncbi:MAG: phosphotransferase [Acidobacteriota bacterium]